MAGGGALSLGRDIAIDLGTANTLVYVKGEGVVLNEPSSVAVDSRTGELVAVGFEAKRMWGRAPQNIRLVRPLQAGVIADFDVCEKMLRYFIQQVHTSRWNKPRMIICVPSEITATSVVPPPISTIKLALGRCTGSPAPIAAAIGSSMM